MKNEKFPSLGDEEVALVICESTTGIILTEKFEWKIDKHKSSYILFKSEEVAKKYVNSLKKPNMEFLLFNNKQEIIFEGHTKSVAERKTKKKWWKFWK